MTTDNPVHTVWVRLPTWVGDVVMATPALRALRVGFPGARLIVEGRGFIAGLLAGLDSFDEYLPSPGPGVIDLWRHGQRLSSLGIDLAVLLPDSARVAIPPWLARVPKRVGYARDPLRRMLLSESLAPPREDDGSRRAVPMVERYLEITRRVGCDLDRPRVELAVDDASRAAVAARLGAELLQRRGGYVVVTPGASFGASKLYPPASFAKACDGLASQHDLAIILAPGPGEEDLCRHVAEMMKSPNLILADPVTTLAEHKALLAGARLALSNDTGPRHMAVALSVPTVTLMGPTDPRHTAYQLERQRVLRESVDCSPCHQKVCPIDHRCMVQLSPRRVLAAAAELLQS